MKVTVEIAPTTIITHWNCAFCGESFAGEAALADIFDEAGEHLGVACPTCLEAGARRVSSRISRSSPLWALPLDVSMPPLEAYRTEVRFGRFLLKYGPLYPTRARARREFQRSEGRIPALERFLTPASPALAQRLAS